MNRISGREIPAESIMLQNTRKEFEGDVRWLFFPSQDYWAPPEETKVLLVKRLVGELDEVGII